MDKPVTIEDTCRAVDVEYYRLQKAELELKREYEEAKRAAEQAAAAPVRARYADRLAATAVALSEARSARWDAYIARAKEELAQMGDLRRVEWDKPGRAYERRPWQRTGRTGKYIVFTYDCGATSGRGQPEPGEIILRVNKSDGTPSARFERLGIGGADPWGWHSVDWTPEKADG